MSLIPVLIEFNFSEQSIPQKLTSVSFYRDREWQYILNMKRIYENRFTNQNVLFLSKKQARLDEQKDSEIQTQILNSAWIQYKSLSDPLS